MKFRKLSFLLVVQSGGMADFFKNQVVLTARTVPLTWMDESP